MDKKITRNEIRSQAQNNGAFKIEEIERIYGIALWFEEADAQAKRKDKEALMESANKLVHAIWTYSQDSSWEVKSDSTHVTKGKSVNIGSENIGVSLVTNVKDNGRTVIAIHDGTTMSFVEITESNEGKSISIYSEIDGGEAIPVLNNRERTYILNKCVSAIKEDRTTIV